MSIILDIIQEQEQLELKKRDDEINKLKERIKELEQENAKLQDLIYKWES